MAIGGEGRQQVPYSDDDTGWEQDALRHACSLSGGMSGQAGRAKRQRQESAGGRRVLSQAERKEQLAAKLDAATVELDEERALSLLRSAHRNETYRQVRATDREDRAGDSD